jgi:uncharacterized RDD family membrane protein YckC
MAHNPNLPDGLPDPVLDSQFYQGVRAKRLAAFFIDLIAVFAITFALSILTIGVGFLIFAPVFLVVNLTYRALTMAAGSATPGMWLTGIEIRNRVGNRLSATEAALHTVLFLLAFFFVILQVISLFLMLTTARGQGLHDLFMGTAAILRPAGS